MNGYLLAGYHVAVIVLSCQHLTSVLLIFLLIMNLEGLKSNIFKKKKIMSS